MRERLLSLAQDDLVAGKMGVFEQLWHGGFLEPEDGLLGYYPHGHELNVTYFLRIWLSHRRALFLPKVAEDGTTLIVCSVPDILAVEPGYRGILEPDMARCARAEHGDVDAVLVPGLAFTPGGARLGQGGGHYDRLLAALPPRALRIGVGYDFQVLEDLPTEAHDMQLHWVVTEQRALRCGKPSG